MKPMNELAIFYAAAAAAAAQTAFSDDASSTIHFSPKLNAGNATAVDKGYIGFGIEMKSLPDFAGRDAPNQLSDFLLSQISTRTGGASIHIRVGGTEYTDGDQPVSIAVQGGIPNRAVVVKASEAVVVEIVR